MKGIRKKKGVYTLLLVLFSLVFALSAFSIVSYYTESKNSAKDYEDLANLLVTAPAYTHTEETQPDGQPVVTTAPPEEDPYALVTVALPDGTTDDVLRKYSNIYPQNTEMVGWLAIPGTKINYPVMHTPNDPEYYLHRNFKKEETKAGCLFIQSTCNAFAPSDNITIYGHNMKDGSMFRALEQYQKKEFWETHKTITFDTIYEHHTYEIMAVFRTAATESKGFAYYAFDYAEDQQAYNEFVQNCHDLELYDTGVTAEYGDKLITLSTCEYSQTNGRLVVVAKQVS